MFQDIGLRFVTLGAAAFRREIASSRSALTGMESDLRKISGASAGFGTQLVTLGSSTSRMGQMMTTSLTPPILLLEGALIGAGISFEDAFAGVGKTVDGISDDFGNLTKEGIRVRDSFRQMALEIPISVNELARIGEVAGQLGIASSEIEEFTKTVALLGVTTDMTSEDAATFFARLGNIMGVAAKDMAEFTKQAGSTVVELGNKFAATEQEIAHLSLRIAGAGQAAGLSTPEILALATAMSSLGIQSEMGGSAISRVLLEMKRASDDFTATGGEATDQLKLFAEAAGLTVDQFVALVKNSPEEALLGLLGGVNRLQEAGMLTNDMLKTMNLDTIRLQDVMNRLGPNIDFVRTALVTSNDEWADGNALQIEAQKRFNTTKSQLILLKNAFVDLGIEIFYLFKTPIDGLIKGLRFLITSLTKLEDGTLKSAMKFGLLAAAVGPVLVVFGTLLQVFGTFITSTKVAQIVLGKVGLSFSALILKATALGVAVVTLSHLWENNFLGIRTTIVSIVGAIEDVVYWINEAFKAGTQRFEGNIFTGISDALKALTYIYEDNARTFFGEVIKAFGIGEERANALGMAIRNALEPVLLRLSLGFKTVGFWVNRFREDIEQTGLLGAVENLFKHINSFMDLTTESPFERIAEDFGLGEEAARKLNDRLSTLITNTKNLWKAISPIALPLLKIVLAFKSLQLVMGVINVLPIAKAFSFLLPLIGSLLPLIVPLLPVIAALGAVVLLVGTNLFGLGDLFNNITGWLGIIINDFLRATGVVDLLKNAFAAFLSGDTETAFYNLQLAWDHVVMWFNTSGKTLISAALKDIFAGLISIVLEYGPKVRDQLLEWGSIFVSWIVDKIPDVIEGAKKLWEDLKKWITDRVPDIKDKLAEWATAFAEWVEKEAAPKLEANLLDFWGRIKQWVEDTLPKLIDEGIRIGNSFIDWANDIGPDILYKLGLFLGEIVGWVDATLIPYMITAAPIIAAQFIAWAAKALKDIGPELLLFSLKILKFFFLDLPAMTLSAIIGFGFGIVNGIKKGIEDNWDSFKTWFTDQITNLKDDVLDIFGVGSPSTFMMMVGKSLVDGLTLGIQSKQNQLSAAVAPIYETLAGLSTDISGNIAGSMGSSVMSPLTNVPSNNVTNVSNSSTRVFSPTINGANVSSDKATGDEVLRAYRMAVLAHG